MAINSADVKHEVLKYMSSLAQKNGVRIDWYRGDEFGSKYRYTFFNGIYKTPESVLAEFTIDFKQVDDLFGAVYAITQELENKIRVHNTLKYCKNDIKYTKEFINSIYGISPHTPYATLTTIDGKRTWVKNRNSLPEIKDVIFNNPATIIFWQDGDKTVVKAQDGDVFDPEKGLAMAIVKKAFGNKGNYCEKIKPWLEAYETQQIMISAPCSMGEALKDLAEKARKAARDLKLPNVTDKKHSYTWTAYHRLRNALYDKKATKADLQFAMEESIGYLGEVLDD